MTDDEVNFTSMPNIVNVDDSQMALIYLNVYQSVKMRKDLATHCAIFNEMVLEFEKSITSLFTVVEKFEEIVGRDQLIVVNLINKFSRLVVTGQIKDEDNQTNSETTNHVASNHKSKIIDEMVEKTKMDLLGGTQQDILGQLESSFGKLIWKADLEK